MDPNGSSSTREEPLFGRAAITLRRVASFLAVGLSGYFALATSCDSELVQEQAIIRIHFAPGQAMAAVRVRADGQLILHFNEELIITRNGTSTDPPVDGGTQSGDADIGGSAVVCAINPMPTWEVPVPAPGTTCQSLNLQNEDARYELFRMDTTDAVDVTLTATAQGETDCNGRFQGKLGVVIDLEEQP
jgi:anti-sigma factor RsiW